MSRSVKTHHVVFLAMLTIAITIACSFLSSGSQQESDNETDSTQTTSQEESSNIEPTQQSSQPSGETSDSIVSFEIYEYKEGLTPGDHFVKQGDGWKPYHAKFRVVANGTFSGQYILDIGKYNMANIGLDTNDANDPYIVTEEGYTYGNTLETFDTIDLGFPLVSTQLDLFSGIPMSGNRALNGSLIFYEVNFSVPEKLTPKTLVVPALDYSVDLPPLNTDNFSEISIQTEQIVNFPATIAIDPNVDIKVSNFLEDDTYITVDYEVTNKNIAEDEYGFFYAALIDSYGFASRQLLKVFGQSYSECNDIGLALSFDNITVGPGQTKTGLLCFKKNTNYTSSFYVLYFSFGGTAGSDNKAILIKP